MDEYSDDIDMPVDDMPMDDAPSDDMPMDDAPSDDVPLDDIPDDVSDDVPDDIPDDVPTDDVPDDIPDDAPTDDVPDDIPEESGEELPEDSEELPEGDEELPAEGEELPEEGEELPAEGEELPEEGEELPEGDEELPEEGEELPEEGEELPEEGEELPEEGEELPEESEELPEEGEELPEGDEELPEEGEELPEESEELPEEGEELPEEGEELPEEGEELPEGDEELPEEGEELPEEGEELPEGDEELPEDSEELPEEGEELPEEGEELPEEGEELPEDSEELPEDSEELAEEVSELPEEDDEVTEVVEPSDERDDMSEELPEEPSDENGELSPQEELMAYMSEHNYGMWDYPEYSQDPEWQRLHAAVYPDQTELPEVEENTDTLQDMEEGYATINAADIQGVDSTGDHFWEHHTNTKDDYMQIAAKLPEVQEQLAQGVTVNELMENPEFRDCVQAYYDPENMVKVEASENGYQFQDDGRHRVAAAQELGYEIPVNVVNRPLSNVLNNGMVGEPEPYSNIMKKDEQEIIQEGNRNIQTALDAKKDDYIDKGLGEAEIEERLEADRIDLQKEFLFDAFHGQNVSTDVFEAAETDDFEKDQWFFSKPEVEEKNVEMQFVSKPSKDIVGEEEYQNFKNFYQKLDTMDLSPDYKDVLTDRFKNMDMDLKTEYNDYADRLNCLDTSYKEIDENGVPQDAAYFSSVEGGFKFSQEDDLNNPLGAGNTFFHESGHMLDWLKGQENGIGQASSYNYMTEAATEDYYDAIQKIQDEKGCGVEQAQKLLSRELMSNPNASNCVSDVFGGITYNKVSGAWGHSTDYWKNRGRDAIGKEAFAEITADRACQNPEHMQFLQRFLPKTLKAYENALKTGGVKK